MFTLDLHSTKMEDVRHLLVRLKRSFIQALRERQLLPPPLLLMPNIYVHRVHPFSKQ